MTTAVDVELIAGSATYTVPVGVRFIGVAAINGNGAANSMRVKVNGTSVGWITDNTAGASNFRHPVAANAGDVISVDTGNLGLSGQLF